MKVVIDIETMPNPDMIKFLPEVKAKATLKDPVKIEKDIAEKKAKQIDMMALNPMYGKIACIGYGGECQQIDINTEKGLLNEFFIRLPKFETLITYNGNNFDLPFIWKRALILGVFKPTLHPRLSNYIKRYDTTKHMDLMQLWAGWNTQNIVSLDTLAMGLLGEKKLDFDFREIPELLKTEKGELKLANYCKQDCRLTWDIYKKIGSVL